MAMPHDGDVAATSGSAAGRPVGKSNSKAAGGNDRDMGSALRSVYQRTIDEAIPDEMLDILGKLN